MAELVYLCCSFNWLLLNKRIYLYLKTSLGFQVIHKVTHAQDLIFPCSPVFPIHKVMLTGLVGGKGALFSTPKSYMLVSRNPWNTNAFLPPFPLICQSKNKKKWVSLCDFCYFIPLEFASKSNNWVANMPIEVLFSVLLPQSYLTFLKLNFYLCQTNSCL